MLVDASTIRFLYQVIMPPFASFSPLCSSPADGILSAKLDTSSPLPHCNLFFSSLLHVSEPPALTRLFDVPIRTAKGVINIANATEAANGAVSESSNADDPLVGRYVSRAGSGVGLSCDVGRIWVEGSLGDIGTSRSTRSFSTWVDLTTSLLQRKSLHVASVSYRSYT